MYIYISKLKGFNILNKKEMQKYALKGVCAQKLYDFKVGYTFICKHTN